MFQVTSMLGFLALASNSLSVDAIPIPSCGGKYLRVTLWDTFGDGWGGAEFVLSDPSNTESNVEMPCDQNELTFNINPTEFTPNEGYYDMTVVTSDSELPTNWWEIYWIVEEIDSTGTETGVYYEGTYNTEMKWYVQL